MPKNTRLKAAAGVAVSFTAVVTVIIVLSVRGVISFQMALLILIALLGLYFGFGVLIAIYRFVGRLE